MASSKRSIRLGLDFSAPIPLHTDYRSGHFEGFEVDMMRAIASQLDLDIEYSVSLWKDILEDLNRGRIDAICSAVTVTEERRRQFDFSLPYLDFHLAAICRSNTLLPDLPSMRDKKIGVRIASEAEKYIRGHLINPILEIHNTNDELYGLLKNSEIDVLIDDGPIAGAFVKQSQSALVVSFLLPDSQSQYAIAFKKGSEIKPLIDQALARLEKQGRLDALRMKWFGQTAL